MKIRFLLMIATAGVFVSCKCVVCDSYDYISSVLPNDSSTAMPVKVSIKSSSDLNGPVRMVREYNWESKLSRKGEKWVKGKQLDTKTSYYDKRGNPIESYYCCDEDGKCDRHWKAVFDDNNDMVYNELTEGNGDTILALFRTYEYDDVGNIIRETASNGKKTSETSYQYYFSEDSVIVRVYDNGVIRIRTVYDDSHREKVVYSQINEAEDRSGRLFTYSYHPNGKLCLIKREDARHISYSKYDTCGNCIEELEYEHKTYECNGRKYLDPNLTFVSRWTRHYDYDNHGNWIRAEEIYETPKSKRKTEKRHTLYEREITYW